MATSGITLGDWGNKIPSAPPLSGVMPAAFQQPGVQAFGKELGHAADKAAEAQQFEQHQAWSEERAKQRQIDAEARAASKAAERDAKNIAALRATTDYGNDVADLHTQLTADVQTGKIPRDKALDQFDQQATKLKEKYVASVDPLVSEQARIHMDNTYRDTRRQVGGTLEVLRREQTVADFGAIREGLERRAIRDPQGAQAAYEAVAKSVLGDAGIAPNKVAADIQAFKEKTTFNFVAGQVNAATNNPAALNTLQKTLSDTKQWEVLDPDKRRILLNQVEGRQETLRMRAERAYERSMNQIGREMDAISRLSLSGIQPTAERLSALQTSVRGTPFQAEFKSYLDGMKDQQTFSQLPPSQMRAQIEADVANVAKNGGNEADKMRIQKRTQSYELATQQLTQDPLAYNARTTGAPIPPIDMTNPKTIPAALQERAAILLPLNKSHGANVGLFRPDEALQARQMLRSLPAEKRAGFMNLIYASVGAGPVYNATMAQISPDSPASAMAGLLFSRGDVTQSRWFAPDTKIVASNVARRILDGEDLMNPPSGGKNEDGKQKTLMPIDAKAFESSFNDMAGNAFARTPGNRATYLQSVRSVYASLSKDAGDYKGVLDTTRMRDAFNQVTGGGVVSFGGQNIIPPFGMTGDSFRANVEQHFAKLREAGNTAAPQGFIKSAQLHEMDDGRYVVVQGGRVLPDLRRPGEPLVINITDAADPVQVAPTNRPVKAGKR